ncbi:MAG TPA: response regulator [Terriglobales bacterium]|nr:response regulator [Terriglobales bacterium]
MARRILLADDSVTAQNMGRRILSDAGYEVVTVNNGSAALKKIAEQKPDLIVLDVYMPGYGGLEVCQRVKENRETARIPVLLTVGKLEPFKPEEARRVRADAFIVKPFEASELLTALTKLEDKIVPQGPQKPGRFAKALAAMEQSGSADSFGDTETGWKNRLTIPPPPARATEGEIPQVASSVVRELWREQESKPVDPKQEFERPVPAGLPPDITPEEIAAITAAAASFGSQPQEPAARSEAEKSEAEEPKSAVSSAAIDESPAEATAATFASAPQSQGPVTEVEPASTAAPPTAETAAATEAAKGNESGAAENPIATDSPVMPTQADSGDNIAAATTEQAAKPWTADAEVMAAIASLAPTNGHADGMAQTDGFVTAAARPEEEIPVIVAATVASAATAAESASGPRWIAEAIPVPEDESTFILQQEMEKAYAAFAAADAGRASYAESVAINTAVSAGESVGARAEQSLVAEASVSESTPAPEIIPMAQAEASSMISGIKEVAYAAGASTSAGSGHASAPEVTSSASAVPPLEIATRATDEGDKQREAELAAAWQNWKQIRESIVGSQLTAQIADAAAAGLKDVQPEEASPVMSEGDEGAAESESDESSTAAGESTAIASIVESVLAELKPKLMEEIAKKMKTDKKDKEKEKKKKK